MIALIAVNLTVNLTVASAAISPIAVPLIRSIVFRSIQQWSSRIRPRGRMGR